MNVLDQNYIRYEIDEGDPTFKFFLTHYNKLNQVSTVGVLTNEKFLSCIFQLKVSYDLV